MSFRCAAVLAVVAMLCLATTTTATAMAVEATTAKPLPKGPPYDSTRLYPATAYTTVFNGSSTDLVTYILFSPNNTDDDRQTWLAASSVCSTRAKGVLANVTGPAVKALFTYWELLSFNPNWKSWGNRNPSRSCVWLGFSTLKAPAYTASLASATSDTFWQEPNAAACGAWCSASEAPILYKRDCDYEASAFICMTTASITDATLAATLVNSVFLSPSSPPPSPPNSNPLYPPPPSPPTPPPPDVSPPPPYPPPLTSPPAVYPSPPLPPPAYPPSPRPADRLTFSTCANSPYGFRYCAILPGFQNALPYAQSDAEFMCENTKSSPDDGLKYTLASFSSIGDLNWLILNSSLPLNSTYVGYWTGGVRPSISSATWVATINTTDSSFITSATIAAPSNSSSWIPTYAYSDAGLPDFKGLCQQGFGCGVGLTFTVMGLQFVDSGFPMGVLCKTAMSVPVLPSGPAPPTPPATKTNGEFITQVTRMTIPGSVCQQINADASVKANFAYGIATSIVAAFFKTFGVNITTGNIDMAITASCGSGASGRLRVLLQSTSSATSSSTIALPTGVSAATAVANAGSLASATTSAITSSSFATTYSISGVTTDPATQTYPSSPPSNNNVAIAVGVAVGVGVPLLVGAGVAAYLIHKRRSKQVTAPAS